MDGRSTVVLQQGGWTVWDVNLQVGWGIDHLTELKSENPPATDGVNNVEVKNLSEAPIEARQTAHAKRGHRLEKNKSKHILIS